jgi:type IV secretory pathway TrbL component
MEAMNKAFAMASSFMSLVIDLGVKLIAVAVVLQILFGAAVPFVGVDAVAGITKLVTALGQQGLVGLVAVAVLFWAFNKK